MYKSIVWLSLLLRLEPCCPMFCWTYHVLLVVIQQD